MTTGIDVYQHLRTRLLELAATLDESGAEAPVPALPLWTIRDTYAHSVGVAADILSGNTDRRGAPEWTAVQVEDRAKLTLDEICAEWTAAADRFDDRLRADRGTWPSAFDLWHHEQDIRAALDLPVDRDPDRLRFVLGTIAQSATANWPDHTPAVRLVADDLDAEWQLGPDNPTATVHASGYELARVTAGRRSRAQAEALGWDNPSPHFAKLPAFSFPERDLVE